MACDGVETGALLLEGAAMDVLLTIDLRRAPNTGDEVVRFEPA